MENPPEWERGDCTCKQDECICNDEILLKAKRDLIDCPFCGGGFDTFELNSNVVSDIIFVHECKIQIIIFGHRRKGETIEDAADRLVDRWNTRKEKD